MVRRENGVGRVCWIGLVRGIFGRNDGLGLVERDNGGKITMPSGFELVIKPDQLGLSTAQFAALSVAQFV